MRDNEMKAIQNQLNCAGHFARQSEHALGGEDPRFLGPKAKPQYTPSRTFNTKHIRLDITVDVKKKYAEGTSETHFELFESREDIRLDAADMKISKVELNGTKTPFTYSNEVITIPLRKGITKGTVRVHYSVSKPKLGIFFVSPSKDKPTKPYQAWTHSEPDEARYWYPCQDWPESKSTIEMHITVADPFRVIANGDLVSTKPAKGKKAWTTFSWKFDALNSTYLNSFAIGNFTVVKDKWKNVSVEYYSEKGNEEKLTAAFGKTPKMMEYLSNYLRYPYPFKKYAQVAAADFIYGGMEHTTCTTQTDWALQDTIANKETPTRPTVLAIHELTHQWFGDLITINDWPHLWLHEGFATYFEHAWFEHENGKDEYDYYRYVDMLEYFDEDKNHYRRPIVTNVYQDHSDIADSGHTYNKAGLVIGLMRNVLGDAGFRDSLAHFINKNAYGTVQSDDLIDSIRIVTGKNLTQFVDQWIYGAGYPELKMSVHYDKSKKMAHVRMVQTARMDDKSLWNFPVTITVTQPNGKETDYRVDVSAREHRFLFPSNGEPLNIVFDSPNAVIKTITTQKPRAMWIHQLRHDSHAINRVYAAQELSKSWGLEEMYAIVERVEKDPFWATRLEAALTLRTAAFPEAAKKLMEIFPKEKDHRVQRAVLETLSFYRLPEVYQFLKKQTERTDSYIVPAEAYRGIGRWKENQDIAFLKKGLDKPAWMDLIAIGVVGGLTAIQSERALKELIALTQNHNPDRVRMTAARAIALVGGKREEATETLLKLTEDPYILVSLAAVSALGQAGDERAIPTLEKMMEGHRDSRVKRAALDSIRMINGGVDLAPYKDNGKTKLHPTKAEFGPPKFLEDELPRGNGTTKKIKQEVHRRGVPKSPGIEPK